MNHKIIEYFLVSEQSEQRFQDRLNDYIELGYQPWGALVINGTKFVQAMVLKEYEADTRPHIPMRDKKVPTGDRDPRLHDESA